jgi:hypothetical protein
MYAIKVEIADLSATSWVFPRQKTMYGGKRIAVGDRIFVFASENEGGAGLIAAGVVTAAEAVARRQGSERQAPLVSISIGRPVRAKRRLGRAELRPFQNWADGRPETERNFKLYRRATNNVVGISAEAVAFLRDFFQVREVHRASRSPCGALAARCASWRARSSGAAVCGNPSRDIVTRSRANTDAASTRPKPIGAHRATPRAAGA